MTSFIVAISAIAVASVAERLHAMRTARAAYLAFGSGGKPAAWTRAAPILRIAAVTALAWGATVLAMHDPVGRTDQPPREASKHLLICLDVSPSMLIDDSGPGPKPMSRSMWAGKVAGAILDRLDADTTRVSVVAFYTKALPVIRDSFDKDVIANILDGLPMYVAFEPGPTDLYGGVNASLEMARVWPSNSALLVVISDGDANVRAATLRVPDSISESIVIGVGDPYRATSINGHSSKQDATSLKQLAARLGGRYHNGARKHLPSDVLAGLSIVRPDDGTGLSLRDVALLAVGVGGFLLALLTPALILFGNPGRFRRARRSVTRRRMAPQLSSTAAYSMEPRP